MIEHTARQKELEGKLKETLEEAMNLASAGLKYDDQLGAIAALLADLDRAFDKGEPRAWEVDGTAAV